MKAHTGRPVLLLPQLKKSQEKMQEVKITNLVKQHDQNNNAHSLHRATSKPLR